MLRITRDTDYAIVLLSSMAQEPENSFSASFLAEKTGLPSPTVGKLLKILTRGKLLESKRGAQGGYTLASNPQDISVKDILIAVEGPVAITECAISDNACSHQPFCRMSPHWERVNDAITFALDQVCLAELCTTEQPTEQPIIFKKLRRSS